MLTKKSISTPLLTTSIFLGSGNAFAADESITSMVPIWPLLVIIGFIFIFRKQLNCVPPIDLEEEPPVTTDQEQITDEPTEPEASETPSPKTTPETTEVETEPDPEPDTETTAEANDNIIDLKDNSEQCQGSTAKGTRCKRKTTLEDASITIDGITYLLTVCRQHNTNQLKPYSGLIK